MGFGDNVDLSTVATAAAISSFACSQLIDVSRADAVFQTRTDRRTRGLELDQHITVLAVIIDANGSLAVSLIRHSPDEGERSHRLHPQLFASVTNNIRALPRS